MIRRSSVELPIVHERGSEIGRLVIQALSDSETAAPILDHTDDPGALPRAMAPVHLLESAEYAYEVRLHDVPGTLIMDKPELFSPDPGRGGRTGRLRTRLYVGTVHVRVFVDDAPYGTASFEIRSRKLGYLDHYRWMLRDITEILGELVMQRFSPSARTFAPDDGRDARTLYQRFAFVASLISSDCLSAAIAQIVARPHRTWIEVERICSSGDRIPQHPHLARQLSRANRGSRTRRADLEALSLPSRFHIFRHEETLDNPENRFVRFVLNGWLGLCNAVADLLQRSEASSAVRRGLAEAEELRQHLAAQMSSGFLDDVGDLSTVPLASVVLQQRPGYREVFRYFLLAEVAAALHWDGGEDVYGAGQRDIATLYEYWAFLQLVAILRTRADHVDVSELFKVDPDGLSLQLVRGRSSRVQARLRRLGRELRLTLTFNQQFEDGPSGSWSLPLRPDISLRIDVDGAEDTPTWLHFDAKYRIDNVGHSFREGFHGPQDARGGDVVKMHAYRDAIRGGAGAFVLYPGTEVVRRAAHTEILPGVGAFGLRPAVDGAPDGVGTLSDFIDEALWLFASQYTQLERTRYWVAVATEGLASVRAAALPFLRRPPADSDVALFRTRELAADDLIRSQGGLALRTSEVPIRLLASPFLLWVDSSVRGALFAVDAAPRLHGDGFWISLGTELPAPRLDLGACASRLLGTRDHAVVSWTELMTHP